METAAVRDRTEYGKIILVRHGEPSLSRDCVLTPAQYEDWWARYDESGLARGQKPPSALLGALNGASRVFSSTLRRARETAGVLADGRDVRSDGIFVEAPLPRPPLPFLKFGPDNWSRISRSLWFFGYSPGLESHFAAISRARAAADRLIDAAANGGDVLLCAHGYFNWMINLALRWKGWQCIHNDGNSYWGRREFVRRPDPKPKT